MYRWSVVDDGGSFVANCGDGGSGDDDGRNMVWNLVFVDVAW